MTKLKTCNDHNNQIEKLYDNYIEQVGIFNSQPNFNKGSLGYINRLQSVIKKSLSINKKLFSEIIKLRTIIQSNNLQSEYNSEKSLKDN